jgi:peptide deformylase
MGPGMPLRKIALIGTPILRERAREVTLDELRTDAMQALIDDMVATMRDANGAGLAANQVHEGVRVCVIEVGDNPRYPYKPKIPLTILVNPVLTVLGEHAQFENYEGCLSVPNLRGVVLRHPELRVQGLDRRGEPLDYVVRGVTAGTFQHEVDHLDGVLFVDRVRDPATLCTWDNFARHREEAFRAQVKRLVDTWGS